MSQPHSLSKKAYAKVWLSYSDQIAQLIDRGLHVNDRKMAEDFLAHVSYYRLSGYCLAFESSRHRFREGVTFDQIRAAYDFDLTLRDLLTEALEIIEIDLRTCFAHHFGERYGTFGHTHPESFQRHFDHPLWMNYVQSEVERSSEQFIDHFKKTYVEYPHLPIWVMMEVISFGTLNRMAKGMWREDRKVVAERYGVQPDDLPSMVLHFSYVRNLCAHHARIWDRAWSVRPELPKGPNWVNPQMPAGNSRLFSTMLLTFRFLKACRGVRDYPSQWRSRLQDLLANAPQTVGSYYRMGMPENWRLNPGWR